MNERDTPTRIVGLRYDGGDALPTVVLKGAGPMAEDLLRQRQRRQAAAPVVHDPALLDALFRLPIDAAIGPDLFHAVAAILAHVLAVDAAHQRVTGVNPNG